MTKGFDQRGFTLIEIIVVFTIIAILSVIGVAAFVSYSRVQTLETSASNLKSTLFLAKSRALSQVKPPEITQCNNQILNGYKVVLCPTSSSNTLCSSPNSYVLGIICSNFSYRVQSTNLPQNITIDSRTVPMSFYFPVISSGVGSAGSIYLTGYGNTRIITIDSIGGIQ